MKKLAALLICIICTLNSAAYEVKDIDGNVFDFEKPPTLASITPSVSETVCALGMQGNLLGVSRYCEYPAELKNKPVLGGFIDPDYEKILTMKPKLIILPKTSDATVRERFKRLGIPCFLIHPDGIENVSKNVLLIGKIFNCEEAAQKIATEIEEEIKPVDREERPKALLLFGKMAAGKGSFAGGLLERAGFENIAYKAQKPWPILSREFILMNPPDVIILEVKENETLEKLADELRKDSIWARSPAVKNNRIYAIDSQTIIVPGPRIIKASKRLKTILGECQKN